VVAGSQEEMSGTLSGLFPPRAWASCGWVIFMFGQRSSLSNRRYRASIWRGSRLSTKADLGSFASSEVLKSSKSLIPPQRKDETAGSESVRGLPAWRCDSRLGRTRLLPGSLTEAWSKTQQGSKLKEGRKNRKSIKERLSELH